MALLGTRKRFVHVRGVERRKKLLESARQLLSEHELDEISLADVAAKAAVPKGSAYHFYDDIQDLYAALLVLLQEELTAVLTRPIRKPIKQWQDVLTLLTQRGAKFYTDNCAARQLQIGPKTPTQLKLRDRQSDVTIGRIYEQHLEKFFKLPDLQDRSRIFFRAVEIADLMFCLSVMEHGRVTEEMCGEADRAATAYLVSYFGPTLPRRQD